MATRKKRRREQDGVTFLCNIPDPSLAGWRGLIDELLRENDGVLSWVLLRDLLVLRYLQDECFGNALGVFRSNEAVRLNYSARHVGKLCSDIPFPELLLEIGTVALSSIPEAYLSRDDRFVRLPTGSSGAPLVCVIPCPNSDSFFSELERAGDMLVVVNFTAQWCGACQTFKPELHQLATEMPEVTFLQVDVDVNRHTADHYGIREMPTTVFVKNTKQVDVYAGSDIDELTLKLVHSK